MDLRNFENSCCVWKPSGINESSNYAKFVKMIERKYEVKLENYWDLHKWSIENIEDFWAEIWDFSEIKYSKKYNKVVDLSVPMSQIPKWFIGARLNFAENFLTFRDNHTALIGIGENREETRFTYAEVYEEVKQYAAAFRKIGLKKGDKVACYMSNREEAIFAMLAAISVGAIWIGILPMLGAQAVLERLQIVRPKYIISIDKIRYEEKDIDMLPKLKFISEGLTSSEKIIIVPSRKDSIRKDISEIVNSCFLKEFLDVGRNADGSVPDLIFEQVSMSHPVFISYTSGTTGSPKAIVHGSEGLLCFVKEICIQNNSRERAILSVSPAGWASWLIGPLSFLRGATSVLYDGVPYFLSPTYLWDIIDEYKISSFFATPSILDELEKKGYFPNENHKLNSLLLIFSGASVVKPQNYEFVYKRIKKNILFTSIYGATEIMGRCMAFHHTLPIYKGEQTCPCLGADIEVVDDEGCPITGEVGDLVISKPYPSMPLGIYGDENGSKYRELYFSKYKDKFSMSDLAIVNPKTKGILICCRNDEAINQFGFRFGSSEIYNVVNRLLEVHDSLCVSQYSKNGTERAVLFLKLKAGFKFNDELLKKVREKIDEELTDEHIPGLIMEVQDIPYNMNGKKMEILIKKLLNKMPYNTNVLRNKESLQWYMNVPPFEE
ncbi:acetoacetyl-CoA synthetase-like [Parasteatoda tepidariorum]|uniref:acetoacetyl-CoA synthetase-like n=1 Tax=Parasteatoda tepidariorum TaxID=114398 RepID=UPI001C71D1F7|nr:acetoacetyl-CoA synthetase-like isoform X1 [Parasteatoda tepidariorum]